MRRLRAAFIKLPPLRRLIDEKNRLQAERAELWTALTAERLRVGELEAGIDRLVDDKRAAIKLLAVERRHKQQVSARLRRSEEQLERLRTAIFDLPGDEGRELRRIVGTPHYATARSYEVRRRRFFDHCRELGRLQPDHAILDVGCGSGGLADQLAGYLGGGGRYVGFDVDPWSIALCRDRLGDRAGFAFEVADVYNGKYNRSGKVKAADYRFPYADGEFDLVVLRSLFTHMLPDGLANYLAEARRVLRPGGRCLATFFLYDDDIAAHLDRASRHFEFDFGTHRTDNGAMPEAAVAYDERFVRVRYREAGLDIVEPIVFGGWSGREAAVDHQDVVVSERPG